MFEANLDNSLKNFGYFLFGANFDSFNVVDNYHVASKLDCDVTHLTMKS